MTLEEAKILILEDALESSISMVEFMHECLTDTERSDAGLDV
jgi:hypothetical protein